MCIKNGGIQIPMRKFIFLTLIFFICSDNAYPACDTTAATIAQLNTDIAAASPGDTVCLQDGTYNNSDEIDIPAAVDGTEADPIILQPETVGGATLSGNPAGYGVMDVDGDWWVIQNFKFIDISETGSVSTYGIIVDGANVRVTNNYFNGFGNSSAVANIDWAVRYGKNTTIDGGRVDYNTFINNTAMCVYIQAADGGPTAINIQIDHNYFNESSSLDSDQCSTMQIGTGGSANEGVDHYTIVEYNIIENWTGDGEGISNKSSSNTYRHNVFKTSGGKEGNGLVLRGGDDCLIDSNYFFDVSRYNLRVHGEGHKIINNYFENPGYGAIVLAQGSSSYASVVDILIANNTIVDFSVRGIYIGWWGSNTGDEPENLTFKNNLIDSAAGTLVYDRGHTGTFTWTTNLHYNQGSATYWANSDGGGSEPGSGITHADPDLTQGTYIKRLQAGSANAIESGTTDGSIADDIDSEARDGSTPDIGCDEYNTPVTAMPIQAGQVGVSWERLYITNALPVNNDTGVNIEVEPSWINPFVENTNDGYFKVGACPTAGGDSVWSNQTHKTSYDPGTLAEATTHCWRVDIDHDGGTETGTDYEFTTSGVPPPDPAGLDVVYLKDGGEMVYLPGGGTM